MKQQGSEFSLRGVAIGDGWSSPLIQTSVYAAPFNPVFLAHRLIGLAHIKRHIFYVTLLLIFCADTEKLRLPCHS